MNLTLESFEPHVGTMFTPDLGEHAETLKLIEAKALDPSRSAAGRAGFSLIFEGTRDDLMINQQLLTLTHPEMDTLAFMVVPIGKDANGVFRYQAIFN